MVEAETKERLLKWRGDPKLPENLREVLDNQLRHRFQWTPPAESPKE